MPFYQINNGRRSTSFNNLSSTILPNGKKLTLNDKVKISFLASSLHIPGNDWNIFHYQQNPTAHEQKQPFFRREKGSYESNNQVNVKSYLKVAVFEPMKFLHSAFHWVVHFYGLLTDIYVKIFYVELSRRREEGVICSFKEKLPTRKFNN